MVESNNGYVTDPATTGKLPAIAAEAAPGKATEALLDHLADLMDQLPHLQAKSERLSNALAAQKIVALHQAKLTADAELAEADQLVARAEAELIRVTASLEASIGRIGVTSSDENADAPDATREDASESDSADQNEAKAIEAERGSIDEAVYLAQEQVLHAGLQRGMRVGPVNNAAAELEEALEESPFESLEEALACALPDDEIALIQQQIADYQNDYNQTLAACQSAEQSGCFPAV